MTLILKLGQFSIKGCQQLLLIQLNLNFLLSKLNLILTLAPPSLCLISGFFNFVDSSNLFSWDIEHEFQIFLHFLRFWASKCQYFHHLIFQIRKSFSYLIKQSRPPKTQYKIIQKLSIYHKIRDIVLNLLM